MPAVIAALVTATAGAFHPSWFPFHSRLSTPDNVTALIRSRSDVWKDSGTLIFHNRCKQVDTVDNSLCEIPTVMRLRTLRCDMHMGSVTREVLEGGSQKRMRHKHTAAHKRSHVPRVVRIHAT